MSSPLPACRVTVHVTAVEREMLGALRANLANATTAMGQAQRDLTVASASIAAARGLRPSAILDGTPDGDVVIVLATEEPSGANHDE